MPAEPQRGVDGPAIKSTAGELALLGGRPLFDEPLHVGRPAQVDRRHLFARLEGMLDRSWYTNRGPLVREFERRLAERLGVKHCIAMCNGTVALEIAQRALGLSGEVIVPSLTFAATAHALQWQQITPVFADVDPETHTLDPDSVAKLITPRTSGIVGVHLWGRPCEIEALQALADAHGLALMFDAAHAFGASHAGRPLGGFGAAEVFSFHATKVLHCFEGGAVATDDDALAEKIRLMQNFGFVGYDRVDYIGTNGKLNEASAAMGLTSLEGLDERIALNRDNYAAYGRELDALPGLTLVRYEGPEAFNYHYIVLEVDADTFGMTRDGLLEALHAENVLARRYFHPGCHRMSPYREHFPHAGLLLPETERLTERLLCLPNGDQLGPDGIGAIGALLRLIHRWRNP